MSNDRAWPVNRARALLLRKAAELVGQGVRDGDAGDLARYAFQRSVPYGAPDMGADSEEEFRTLLMRRGFSADDIDGAVTEVYHDGRGLLVDLPPVEQVVAGIVSDPERWDGPLPGGWNASYYGEISCGGHRVPLQPRQSERDAQVHVDDLRRALAAIIARERRAAFEAGQRSAKAATAAPVPVKASEPFECECARSGSCMEFRRLESVDIPVEATLCSSDTHLSLCLPRRAARRLSDWLLAALGASPPSVYDEIRADMARHDSPDSVRRLDQIRSAVDAACTLDPYRHRAMLLRTASLCVAAIESHDRGIEENRRAVATIEARDRNGGGA